LDISHLDNPANVRPGFLEDGDDVPAAGLCLVRDAALDQRAAGVGGDLARDEDVRARGYRLRLWGTEGVGMGFEMGWFVCSASCGGGLRGHALEVKIFFMSDMLRCDCNVRMRGKRIR